MILGMYLARIVRPASGYRIHTVTATRNRAEIPVSREQGPRSAPANWIGSIKSAHSDLQDMSLQPHGTERPGCPCGSAPEGVGNAGCQRTRSRACSVVNTRVSHHGYAETPGIPARNGFNGFLRTLPGDRAFLSPSPLRSLLLTSLTPASRRQDHTTSPSA